MGRAGLETFSGSGVYGPDAGGAIIVAVYLEETDTGGKLWSVQREPLSHPNSSDSDDPIDLGNLVYVSIAETIEFDLTNAPAGQNLYVMYGDGNITEGPAEIGIIVNGYIPWDEGSGASNTKLTDSVNSSKVDDDAFASNSQNIAIGDGLHFSYITNPESDFTVPNLDPGEAGEEGNILFGEHFESPKASVELVQVVKGTTAEITIEAFNVSELAPGIVREGDDFIDSSGLTGSVHVDITDVIVKNEIGTVVETFDMTTVNQR